MLDLKLPKIINEINYFKKEERGCTLYSYPQDKSTMTICKNVDLEIAEDFCIDQSTLELIRNLLPINEFEIKSNKIKVVSKQGKLSAKLLQEDLPSTNFEFENEVEVEVETLIKAKNFVSAETNNYFNFLSGVKINNFGDVFATDRYTAFRKLSDKYVGEKREGEEKYVLITKDFIETIKAEFDPKSKIKIAFNDTKCKVEKEDYMQFISGVLVGKYPDLNNIFNSCNCYCPTEIDIEDLKAKAKLVDKIKTNADKIIFYCFENGKLKIEGESSFETTICEKTTDEYSFVLSHLNVKKLLASASGKIIFYYSGDKKPILFVEKSNEILLLPIARKSEEK